MIMIEETIKFKVFKPSPTPIYTINECRVTNYNDSYVCDIQVQAKIGNIIDYSHTNRRAKETIIDTIQDNAYKERIKYDYDKIEL